MATQLKLDFMGGLTKFQSKNGDVRQFQVKTFGMDNDGEITSMVRDMQKWANNNNVPQLESFCTIVPPTDIAWSKITLPMDDYSLYFDVDFGHDIYSDQPGFCFKAKLTEIAFSIKKGMREAVLTFIKNGEESDDGFQRMFLNYKETDENGKKKPKPFQVKLEECESFVIGNPPPEESDDDDVDEIVIPEVN